jgi:hypothetical protein
LLRYVGKIFKRAEAREAALQVESDLLGELVGFVSRTRWLRRSWLLDQLFADLVS